MSRARDGEDGERPIQGRESAWDQRVRFLLGVSAEEWARRREESVRVVAEIQRRAALAVHRAS